MGRIIARWNIGDREARPVFVTPGKVAAATGPCRGSRRKILWQSAPLTARSEKVRIAIVLTTQLFFRTDTRAEPASESYRDLELGVVQLVKRSGYASGGDLTHLHSAQHV
jgi:hypothetical protein